jgi:hypothetical protein
VTRSDEEFEALEQLAADIRLLSVQCAELGDSTTGKLIQELIRHMTESLHLLMDRPDALQGTMPWWRNRLSQPSNTAD